MKRFILLLFLIGCSVFLNAYRPIKYELPPSGKYKVVKIYDGDTFTILVSSDYTFNVRIQGIDAPEKKQEFGLTARQYLDSLIANKCVLIQPIKVDKYGRTVAICTNYEGKDIGLEMIKSGMAWFYSEFYNDSSYKKAENFARLNKLGLWKNPNPVKPQNFRNPVNKSNYKLVKSGNYYVVSVYDGDTFIIRDTSDSMQNIRIQGIDAPELSQNFGSNSRQYLLSLIKGNQVNIISVSVDNYGRTVAKCSNIDGKDIGYEMIKAGMAWYYNDYYKNYKYQEAELNARIAKKGLFSLPSPTRPKVYRKKN